MLYGGNRATAAAAMTSACFPMTSDDIEMSLWRGQPQLFLEVTT
jgi:hypothetical protein